ncbi:MAG: glycoside hydrolase [Chloroflexota bacterium]|mgnify:FL=1
MTVLLLVGTRNGGFIIRSPDRKSWEVTDHFFESWSIQHVTYDWRDGSVYAAVNSHIYGPMVARSTDLGKTWVHSSAGLTYGEGSRARVKQVWQLCPGPPSRPGELWAGVEDAGLFRSRDHGRTWEHIESLRRHPTVAAWEPSGGGLILANVLIDPDDPDRIWVGVGAGGVYRSDDGGQTWKALNRNIPAPWKPNPMPEAGQCVHKLRLAPKPGRLYHQNHVGMYRSDDYGETWVDIGANGLPSSFGFAAAVHPRDPDTAYFVPHISDDRRYVPDAAMAVWRTRDAGGTWQKLTNGLPQRHAYLTVLRDGLATDTLEPAGVYAGTSTGHIFASADEGDTWQLIVSFLPPINSVEAVVL